MSRYITSLALILLLPALVLSDTDVTVTTTKGLVVGLSVTANPATSNTPFDAYRGIPYGKTARFQLAVPPDAWTTTLDARKDGAACPQPFSPAGISYSEDCLFINVYTPAGASTATTKLPVMVFIHGSDFTFFSSNSQIYGPDFFVANGVILVTFNYRLGAPGFLTLGSSVAPGNLGLHDSLLGLQWVQTEINAFGGNASQVTLFGQSAGSIMTLFHYLSPLSTGLFQRAIGQSGSPVSDAALVSPAEGARRAKVLAKQVGCDITKNDSVILTCLQQVKIEDIIGNQSIALPSDNVVRGSGIPFVPVLDSQLTSSRPFFNNSIDNLMSQAQSRAKPLIMGFNRDEGIFLFSPIGGGIYNQAEANLGAFLPGNAHKWEGISSLRTRYFNNTPTLNKVEGLVQLYTDYIFAYPTVQVTRYFANLTYGYVFAYDGSWASLIYGYDEFRSQFKMTGVAHAVELAYLFYSNATRQSLDPCAANSDNLQMSKSLINWWTTFAKTGVPDPSWKTVNATGYRVIDSTPAFINNTMFESQYYDFWSNLQKTTSSGTTAKVTLWTLLIVIFYVISFL